MPPPLLPLEHGGRQTPSPKPQTLNPKPQTPNPKPQTLTPPQLRIAQDAAATRRRKATSARHLRDVIAAEEKLDD